MAAPKGNKFALGKKGGAPSKYGNINLDKLAKLSASGCTDEQMAIAFDISRDTFLEYKKIKEFSDTLTRNKKMCDDEIVHSLYERARGFEHPSEEVFQFQGTPIRVPITKKYAPDTEAIKYWLGNRQPKDWRDRKELEIVGKVDKVLDALAGTVIQFVPEDKRIECGERLRTVLDESNAG